MLNLKDLVNSIASKFQGPIAVGDELYRRKDGRSHPCKIVEVIEVADRKQYEIEWLDDDQKMTGKALVNGDELTVKNPLFSKSALKSFIKDSTYRHHPWVLHDNLAKRHGISVIPPEEMKSSISLQNGLVVCSRKRKKSEETQTKVNMTLCLTYLSYFSWKYINEIVSVDCTKAASGQEIKVYVRRNKLIPSSTGKSEDGGKRDGCLFSCMILHLCLVEHSMLFLNRYFELYICREWNASIDDVH